jgi:DNA-binding MarR family transcriptional regulator
LQGRYPDRRASSGVGKKERFSGLGFFAEHVGRQKMPVVWTAVTNRPSKEESLDRNASSITDSGGRACVDMATMCHARFGSTTEILPWNPEGGLEVDAGWVSRYWLHMATINSHTDTLAAVAVDPGVAGDAHALGEALSDLIRVVQFRDRDRACCYDVSVSQCYALKAVADGGPLTVNDLAAHLFLDKSTASRIANGLVGMGYLARARDPGDGRVVRLLMTPEGRALHERITDDLAREYGELLGDFDQDVRDGLVTLLGRLGRAFAARVEVSGGTCCVVRQKPGA